MIRAEAIGVLGRDAEMRATSGGTQVLNFSVAAKGSRRDADTVWLSCALFGARADKLQPFLTKGKKVFVRGEFKVRSWSKGEKSGVDVDVTVDEVELLGDRQTSEERAPEPAPQRRPARQAPPPRSPQPDFGDYSGGDDDIPF